MYTSRDIAEFRIVARCYGLEIPAVMNEKTDTELARVCNGIGPASWSERKRKILTKLLFRYEVAAVIHDIDYEYKDVSKAEADNRFRRNMLTIWRKSFGWKCWLTRAGRAERAVIEACYAAVRLGGGEAWKGEA